ncbi:MAG TPA: hypothetical protein DEU72_08150 [Desulfomicrobiaceae bacterium]|nr:hypothetical protein [Desulfomicrobiaceae bacterium]
MDILIVSAVALTASGLTLFSGFGLGTLLMPVVALFFPVEMAIAITAIVHLANNLFKLALLGKKANASILMRFGIPAVVCAFLGAGLLGWLADVPPILQYTALGAVRTVSPIKLVVGILIMLFVALELSPRFSSLALPAKYLPYGGMVSGFFGGLSGHQGAFRSMFLLKVGLDKESFVATGVVLAVMVDISRMLVYGLEIFENQQSIRWDLVIFASIAAFAGAFIGSRMLKKVTLRSVQMLVALFLSIVSIGFIFGIL